MLAFIALALLMRIAFPSGWMPSFADGAVQISVCSGNGQTVMWLDKSGKTHKSDPSGEGHENTPCTFASVGPALPVPFAVRAFPQLIERVAYAGYAETVSVGRGLAAPPPPQTGPPILI